MSSPSQPSGTASYGATRRLGVRGERAAATTSAGSSTGNGNGFCVAQLLGHLAADEDGVGATAEVLEDAELVLDLGAAGDEHERALDLAEQRARGARARRAGAGPRRRQQVRDGLGRRVRAVRRAERVVHVEVAARRRARARTRVVLRLARVEARVLEHVDALVGEQAP